MSILPGPPPEGVTEIEHLIVQHLIGQYLQLRRTLRAIGFDPTQLDAIADGPNELTPIASGATDINPGDGFRGAASGIPDS